MRFVLILLSLSACTQFPELDHVSAGIPENADYPALVPIEPILATARSDPAETQDLETSLTARVAALKTRAARLRRGGQIVDTESKDRMSSGVSG